MGERTPTPWVQFAIDGHCDSIMPAGRAGDICSFREPPSDADAAFIIQAVNSHDALVKALEKIACRHVTEQPLWWQLEAREALRASLPSPPPAVDAETEAAPDDRAITKSNYTSYRAGSQ